MALWLCRGFFRVFICNFASRKTLIGGLRFLLCVYKSPFCGLECGIYHVESVKMTKKSIFRDQFSWKVRTFAHAFRKGCRFFCCSISLPNLHLERDFYEQNQYYIEAVPYGADFNHSSIGAVQGPVESMGRGLRFLYAHTDSASPYQTLIREL